MKHTPGPWAVIQPNDDEQKYFTIGRDRLGAPFGVIPSHLKDGKPHYIACVYGALASRELALANANLVAAAPGLLAALEELADLMDDVVNGEYSPDSFTTQPARIAIAKAKGE